MAKLQATIEWEEFDGELDFTCHFTATCGNLSAGMHLFDPTAENVERVQRFVDSLGTSTVAGLRFCDSNGGVSITHDDDDAVTFETSKFGAGGSGQCEMKLSAVDCREAFALFLEAIAKVAAGAKQTVVTAE